MNTMDTDILVIGSGIAGLHYAIRCSAFARVLIVTKGKIGESNTMYAQGGIAAVFDEKDSIENHIKDTLVAGDGLCDEAAVRLIAENARQCILNLCSYHVNFDKTLSGGFDLHREGGHSFARVVHNADATGKEVETAMVNMVRHSKNISVLENHFAIDLITENNTCAGASVVNQLNNECSLIRAKVVMLATGGAGQLFTQNTNPAIATGDGFAMAQRAGATIANIEFVQFHPTTLYAPGKECFLISEAVRGFGAQLKNKAGFAFMDDYHQLASLAPRDIVTRAILNETKKTNEPCVFLDLRGFDIKELKKHFPNICAKCAENGLDLSKDMIPVVPAAHYMCGGVLTDLQARTSVKNLYACGEVSCTGVHGANRLASNSLLEGLVFAEQAEKNTRENLDEIEPAENRFNNIQISSQPDNTSEESMKNYLQNLMWHHAGIIRRSVGLVQCIEELNAMHQKITFKISATGFTSKRMELQNMIECALMIVESALRREESRGCHYRTDFPQKSPTAASTFLTLQNFGFITV